MLGFQLDNIQTFYDEMSGSLPQPEPDDNDDEGITIQPACDDEVDYEAEED